jgi:pyrroline-5-carboxylate reductase
MISHSDAAADLPRSLLLVGAGKMGGAMLEGWLARGLDPERVTVLEPHPSPALLTLAAGKAIALNPSLDAIEPPELVVLAIKPQALPASAPGLAPLVGPASALVSILAGKTVADLRRALPGASAIVRAMPNLPASIGRGATGAYATRATTARQRAATHALLAANGIVEWVEHEDLIDAVTALSGSGPAYVFHLVECMAAAGAAAGLPAELAARLARATVSGAGALLDAHAADPAELRRNVTSPGGTTAAALAILMGEPGMTTLMREAVAAAKRRAAELSG